MVTARENWRYLTLVSVLATACGAGFATVYALTVRTEEGRRLSDASLRGALLGQSRTSDLVERILAVVSVASLLAALVFLMLIALVRLQRGLGIAAIGMLVAANLTSQVLKSYLLDRPDLGLVEYTPATLNSLPSGHATAAFSVVVALLIVVPARVRSTVAVGGGAYACATALATMFAGWHRAADSVASFLLVGFFAALALGATATFEHLDGSATGSASPRRRWWSVLGLVTFAGALLLTGLLLAAPTVRDSTLGQFVAFLDGLAFVVAAAIGVLVSVLSLTARLTPAPPEEPALPG